jgi:hypothetical protein
MCGLLWVDWWVSTISLMVVAGVFAGILWKWCASLAVALGDWYPTLGIALAVGIGVAILRSAWWFWWLLPKSQADRVTFTDRKAHADIEDNFRKTNGQLIGGAAVLVGAGVAYWEFAQRQQASHDLFISNQVSKGFELLGSPTLAIRLGGIYGLEGVMNNSREYSQPILDGLSAFVRVGTEDETKIGIKPQPDIQAALSAIVGRKLGGVADLSHAHIPGANLSKAHFGFANLSEADLSGADMTDAILNNAKLRGADLNNANLKGATVSSQKQLDEACGVPRALPSGLGHLSLKPCPFGRYVPID